VIKCPVPSEDLTEELIKMKETATYRYARILQEKGLIDELIEF
jgi:26S proteasome regulatory subunit N6